MEMYADVILPLPLPGFFTYRIPEILVDEAAVGKRALVPFGKSRFYAAVIRRIHEQKPQHYAAKEILSVLDELPVVNQIQLSFWEWIADYYLSTCGEVMAVALPSAFKLASETKVELHPDFSGDISSLSAKEVCIVEALDQKKTLSIGQVEKILQKNYVVSQIKNLIEKGVVSICEEVTERYTPRKENFLLLAPAYASDLHALSDVLEALEVSSRTQSQADVLLLLIADLNKKKTDCLRKSEFLKHEQVTEGKLSTLVKKGIVVVQSMEISRLQEFERKQTPESIRLSSCQQQALNEIKEKFLTHDKVLLHGVTGSGKTEIYIKLIQETIQAGKQVLYLLPEIALTMQIINRLRAYFGNEVGVYHSHFNDMERIEIWNITLKKGERDYKIILGARSAIFLPFVNLGLIIIDEEHDYSYKQFDPGPRYNARDAAIVLAGLHGAKVCLGTATPSLESYFNARKNKYALVSLFQRYGDLQLPQIRLIDVRKERRDKRMHSHYTQTLLTAIEQALLRKEQVILFQNRRGFSVHLECKLCGYIPHCKNCDVTLTYHKHPGKMRCHYCSYTDTIPAGCPQCGHPLLDMHGFGTEKVEEEIRVFFPDARIARLDHDSTQAKQAYSRILDDFENQKTDILIGTQMVTKGLDFDNVSVVGILNADNMLHYPDFRSLERSFQLMMQVSGRAGRKNKQGLVLIQTNHPGHEVFEYLRNNDYYTLFNRLLKERMMFRYPPLFRLVKVTLKHRKSSILETGSSELAESLRLRLGSAVLGPEYPLISRINNYYRKDILIKLSVDKQLRDNKSFIVEQIRNLSRNPVCKSIFVHVDVDPYG
jgi:primosomal protein N' (replication factor Y)